MLNIRPLINLTKCVLIRLRINVVTRDIHTGNIKIEISPYLDWDHLFYMFIFQGIKT